MATNEFDPVSREELIKRAAPKKSALQIHKEEQEAKKQQRIEQENQERILRNRGTSLAREREREKARAKAEADRAKYEADLAAYNEQQRQIQRGELVRNLPVDSDLAEFGAASTAPGLMLTRPDKPIEAAIEPVRSKYQSRPEWIWDPERDEEFEGDIGGERYTDT